MPQYRRQRLEELVEAQAARPLKEALLQILERGRSARDEALEFVGLPESSGEVDTILRAFEVAREEGRLQESPWLNATEALAAVAAAIEGARQGSWSLLPDAPQRIGLVRTNTQPSMGLILDLCQLTGDGVWIAGAGQDPLVGLDLESGGAGWQRARVLLASGGSR